MATWEEASKCPRCGTVGQEVAKLSGPNRSTVHTLQCVNDRCVWFDSRWIVQRLEDGSIPERTPSARAPKEFPPIPGLTKEQVERTVEAIDDER